MGNELRVYELRFAERAALCRAFDRVNADPDVASCSFEVVPRRIRMLARRAVAEPLVERFYLEGGLAWCSRHPFDAPQSNTITLRATLPFSRSAKASLT